MKLRPMRHTRRGMHTPSKLLLLVRAAAADGVVLRLQRTPALELWELVREELVRERGGSLKDLAEDQDLRAEVYAQLLTLAPAIFRTRGELLAARSVARGHLSEHLLPDMLVTDAERRPANRAARRRAKKG